MTRALDNPLYYLENFQTVLAWVAARYGDLLTEQEQAFVDGFGAAPQPARALLVRMIMRRGELFRANKLVYAEIGDVAAAAAPLLAAGWISDRPAITLDQVFGLLTKPELADYFPLQKNARKADQLAALQAHYAGDDGAGVTRSLQEWAPASTEVIYQLTITALCDRLRLMFFGNAYQDWTEFVLSDLGIYRYEKVDFPTAARAFSQRTEIDDYLALHGCRRRFEEGVPLVEVLADIPEAPYANPWIERRREKLLYQIALEFEKAGGQEAARAIYQRCGCPGARQRHIRVLELLERFDEAYALAQAAQASPESAAEQQQVARMLPRLRRKAGLPKLPAVPAAKVDELLLQLPRPPEEINVEEVVRAHLHDASAPVHYVENALINSLFGLLCWDIVFLPLPGAFFHPFQQGPADLHAADFYQRRQARFDQRFAEFETGEYLKTIRARFVEKAGVLSPFVFWNVLTEELLEQALTCIPAAHLHLWCRRLLADLKANRSGYPDLIQFWPQQKRYRMIEVKGPGDRLQDNQLRLLDYCAEHAMPVTVCYLRWQVAQA
jgi:hypothetical protein